MSVFERYRNSAKKLPTAYMSDNHPEGWAISTVGVWHYFRNGKSVCTRAHVFLGSVTNAPASMDACVLCADVLGKEERARKALIAAQEAETLRNQTELF